MMVMMGDGEEGFRSARNANEKLKSREGEMPKMLS